MSLLVTLADLRAEVQRFMGYGRDTAFGTMPLAFQQDVTSIIKRGMRQFYFPPPLAGETSSHQWSFMRFDGTLILPAPVTTTATCTVVNGLAVFSANILDNTYKHTVIKFTSTGGYYEVASTNGNNHVTLRDTTVNIATPTTATFYWNRADMPHSGVDVNIFYNIDMGKGPLKNVNSQYMHNLAQHQTGNHIGWPAMFSVEPMSWDQAAQTWHVRFYPFANQATAMRLRMRLAPDGLTNTGDVPLGGVAHYETIVASCLAVAEEFADTPSSKYRELFLQRLAASVMADRTGMYASNLGYNGDNSDNVGKPLPREVTVRYTP